MVESEHFEKKMLNRSHKWVWYIYIQNYVEKTFVGSAQTVKKIRVNFLPQKFPIAICFVHVYTCIRYVKDYLTPYLTGLFLDKGKGLTDLLKAAEIYK